MLNFLIKNRLVLSIIAVISFNANAQNYVDLVKLDYSSIFNAGYENYEETTSPRISNVSLLYPIKLDDKYAIISGIDFNNHNIALFPESDSFSLSNITLKAGLSVKHTDKLSGTYVFLPRLSSEGLHVDGNDFFFGGIVLMKYQKTDNFQWRFGAYASTEGFGVLATPVFGLHYLSDNEKLEITANLPINADVNYNIGNTTSIGFGLVTPVKSYSLKPINGQENYVQISNIEFGPYFETRLMDNSLLLRLHGGYSTAEYLTFEEGDTLDFRLSAFEFGERTQINPDMSGGVFAKIGLIYRFHLD